MKRPAPGLTLLAVLGLVIVAGLAAASVAGAEFGPIQLVSKSATEQGSYAFDPAISEDGEFVAYSGRIGGRVGVFRKDLATGEIRLVAPLSEEDREFAAPSISADGRYVAFTSRLPLTSPEPPEAGGSEQTEDVYVADLSTSPPTYELASARDGCVPVLSPEECALTYGPTKLNIQPPGARAAAGVALSADGREVAFLTNAPSNLSGDPAMTQTPPGEVAVRNLDTDRTTLVTTVRGSDQPVAGVGEYPIGGADPQSEGAALSGDGTTVAWVGTSLPEQVPMLPDEEAAVGAIESGFRNPEDPEANEYHEPLWRRLPSPAEPDPPTRRMVGGGDPLAPGCPPGGTLANAACQGPFPEIDRNRVEGDEQDKFGYGWGNKVPHLTADGMTACSVGNPDEDYDAYLISMAPGLSRLQAVRRLTQWVRGPGSTPASAMKGGAALVGAIESCAISADGNRVAFATPRQVFPLTPPTLVSPRATGPALAAELYQIDLRGETIERATPGGGGSESLFGPEGLKRGADHPSYDAGGRLLAFESGAYNLVGGDTNSNADAFVVESPPPPPVGSDRISPGPGRFVLSPLRKLTLSARSRTDGRIQVVVGVPGGGLLMAKARSPLGRKLKTHQVAKARSSAVGPGAVAMVLDLPRHLRRLAHRKGGLYTEIAVSFSGPGGAPLHSEIGARFRVHPKKGTRTKAGKR